MENNEHRAVIRFLTMEEETGKKIHERMCIVYGGSASSYATVKCWIEEFKRGRKHLEDEPRSVWPETARAAKRISGAWDKTFSGALFMTS